MIVASMTDACCAAYAYPLEKRVYLDPNRRGPAFK
jgi:hypothetical protein